MSGVIAYMSVFNTGKESTRELAEDVAGIRSELDDHLETINQQETDINELVARIEKLEEVVEQIRLKTGYSGLCDDLKIDLSFIEKKIFMLLYALETKITLEEISQRLNIAAPLVEKHIESMQRKGIAIWRQKSLDNKTYLLLDREFRELQAKSNFLGVNRVLSKELVDKNLI
ncbi:MAG: hypothetical protein V1659_04245 [Candidatus Woesearchaeota archaeon]